MRKRVMKAQFEISDEGILHKPTGCTFTPHPGNPYSGTRREGRRGSKLPNGDDYDVSQLDSMMEQLWAEYVLQRKLPGYQR
jgi:hypothetical protein